MIIPRQRRNASCLNPLPYISPVYNVPNDKFGKSYGDTFVAVVNWIFQAQCNNFVCANKQHYLVRDSVATCWPCGNCDQFLNAIAALWNDWA